MSGLGNEILQGGDGQPSLPSFAAIAAAIASEDAARAKLRAAVQSEGSLIAAGKIMYVLAKMIAKDLGVPGVGVAEVLIDLALEEASRPDKPT